MSWWLVPAMLALFACFATSIPMGVWLLVTSRWPSWMRGGLKWPLGNRISPNVVALQGWSYLLIGAASLVLCALLVAFPTLLTSTGLPVRFIVGVTLLVVVLLLICGCVPYVRSVRMSR